MLQINEIVVVVSLMFFDTRASSSVAYTQKCNSSNSVPQHQGERRENPFRYRVSGRAEICEKNREEKRDDRQDEGVYVNKHCEIICFCSQVIFFSKTRSKDFSFFFLFRFDIFHTLARNRQIRQIFSPMFGIVFAF